MRKAIFPLLLLMFCLTSCAKMRIITVPSRDNAAIYINGEQVSNGTASVNDSWRVYRSLDIEARGSNGCIVKRKVTSKFSGAICAVNILVYGLSGLSIGISASGFSGNIGEGALYGSLIGLAIGGIACPIFSWKLPQAITLDVTQCNSPGKQTSSTPNPLQPTPPPPTRVGCQKDTDCKGKRICENGRCVYPRKR